MKKLACDICQAEVDLDYDLVELVDRLKTTEVKHVCRACEKVLQKAQRGMQAVALKSIDPWLKRVIRHKRDRAHAKAKRVSK